MIKQTSLLNKNLPKTSCPSFISTHVDRWERDLTLQKQENVKEPILKSLMIKFKPTEEQKIILDRDLHTSNYVYNRTLSYIKNKGFDPIKDKRKLRDLIVTQNTQINDPLYIAYGNFKKGIYKQFKDKIQIPYIDLYKKKQLKLRHVLMYVYKQTMLKRRISFIQDIFKQVKKNIPKTTNTLTHDWEYLTHKDVRAGAVFTVCNAYKTAIANVKAGHQKFFNIKYRQKKKLGTSMVYSKKMIKIKDNVMYFTSNQLTKKEIDVGTRTTKKLEKLNVIIDHDTTISKKHNEYFINIPLSVSNEELIKIKRIVGIDPGVRVFMTCFGDNAVTEYKHNSSKLDHLDMKLELYKKRSKEDRYRRIIREKDEKTNKRTGPRIVSSKYNKHHQCYSWMGPNDFELINKRIRKRKYNKLERKKANFVNELHWKTINSLLSNYDAIFLGKLDSQGFVKGGKNKKLNRQTNNLKHYLFRQRLIYKAKVANKYVRITPEHHTTKTCSSCGSRTDPKKSKIFTCSKCKKSFDRDINSAKNILMKGILY